VYAIVLRVSIRRLFSVSRHPKSERTEKSKEQKHKQQNCVTMATMASMSSDDEAPTKYAAGKVVEDSSDDEDKWMKVSEFGGLW
jgi:hypothetical protein